MRLQNILPFVTEQFYLYYNTKLMSISKYRVRYHGSVTTWPITIKKMVDTVEVEYHRKYLPRSKLI